MGRTLKELVDPCWSAAWLIGAIVFLYVVLPIGVYRFSHEDPYLLTLAAHSLVACVAIAVGFMTPICDSRFRPGAWRVNVDARTLHFLVWGSFVLLLATTLVTAESVPLISALKGATAQELSDQRAAFFKMRAGWQQALNYLNAFLTSYIMPMSFIGVMMGKSRYRVFVFFLFMAYCELIIEKILYLRVLIPTIYLIAKGWFLNIYMIPVVVFGCFVMLYLNTYLARGSEPGQGPLVVVLNIFDSQSRDLPPASDPVQSPKGYEAQLEAPSGGASFFAADYAPRTAFKQVLWRAFAIPVVTAADWYRVFENKYGSRPFWGATSSMVSALFGLERINFEALVHGTQWGGGEESPSGRSNSFYVSEAYVNFGLPGVVVFSLFIGQALRWFYKSRDEAFRGIWLLFVFGMLTGGLIGNMFSNGLFIVFFYCLFVRVRKFF
ncbi:hypothetical protein [Mesorhizobium retamae]|uniref:Oligosaccharide repeat unit polymerase n=1 Tax=Mesorhizobium retamae TaxID=2912854 RepID=A0ABS9QFR3_9HYPH|nr:hypothetical protein [Mesorhizobium sp. IRAMC:0171]MCG7506261.1 hypothetical protein [Mesorhizobium sp. IRAMC:0171]